MGGTVQSPSLHIILQGHGLAKETIKPHSQILELSHNCTNYPFFFWSKSVFIHFKTHQNNFPWVQLSMPVLALNRDKIQGQTWNVGMACSSVFSG